MSTNNTPLYKALNTSRSNSVKAALRTGRKVQNLQDAYKAEANGVRLLSKEVTQKRIGNKAKIFIMPTRKKGGALKAVDKTAAAISIIYGLKRPIVIEFVMANITLMNNITNWHAISKTKVLQIPSLDQVKKVWLNPQDKGVSNEAHCAENLKFLYDKDDTFIDHASSEGSFEINRKVFAPIMVGPCFLFGTLTGKFGITVKLVPKSKLHIKNKVKYTKGDSSSWKPEATLFASQLYGEIGSEFEIAAGSISSKLKLGSSKFEVKVGQTISIKAKTEIYKIDINNKTFKVEVYSEFEYEILYKFCPPPVAVNVPEPDFVRIKLPKVKPEELAIWGLLAGIAGAIYQLLDRVTSRVAPIIMPSFMLEQFNGEFGPTREQFM